MIWSLLSLLVGGAVGAQTSPPATPPPISPGSLDGRPDCRPGRLCPPGSVVSSELVGISPADAREALLALRLLPDVEADLLACRTAGAERAAALVDCRARTERMAPAAPSALETWLGRAGWLLSGVAVGLAVGVVVAVSAR